MGEEPIINSNIVSSSLACITKSEELPCYQFFLDIKRKKLTGYLPVKAHHSCNFDGLLQYGFFSSRLHGDLKKENHEYILDNSTS